MQPYLIFSLTAALASMGELAGHERRGSLQYPLRSSLIGLMGAALGYRREDDFSSFDSLQIDVAIFDAGSALRYYHTAQTVPSAVVKKVTSRPQALREAGNRANTVITLRDYRTSPLYGIAVSGDADLEAIATALRFPHFALYLGRKSCPLSAPTGAKVVSAQSSEQALGSLQVPPWYKQPLTAQTLMTESPNTGDIVHDVPVDRTRWHFKARRVQRQNVAIHLGDT